MGIPKKQDASITDEDTTTRPSSSGKYRLKSKVNIVLILVVIGGLIVWALLG